MAKNKKIKGGKKMKDWGWEKIHREHGKRMDEIFSLHKERVEEIIRHHKRVKEISSRRQQELVFLPLHADLFENHMEEEKLGHKRTMETLRYKLPETFFPLHADLFC